MEVYFCKDCEYYTEFMSNFKRHMETKSHNDNFTNTMDKDTKIESFKKKIFCCNTCDLIYMSKQALQRHEPKCVIRTELHNVKTEVERLKREMREKDHQIKTKDKQLNDAEPL